jgi:hypothetical protein
MRGPSELLGLHERDHEIAEERDRDRAADQVLDHVGLLPQIRSNERRRTPRSANPPIPIRT